MVYSLKYTKIFKKQIENVKKKNKVLMKELLQKVKKFTMHPTLESLWNIDSLIIDLLE